MYIALRARSTRTSQPGLLDSTETWRTALKNIIGLALSVALMLVVAGCSSTAQNTNACRRRDRFGGREYDAQPGFCRQMPGSSLCEAAGLDGDQVMQQENIKQGDIPRCEQWIAESTGRLRPTQAIVVAAWSHGERPL